MDEIDQAAQAVEATDQRPPCLAADRQLSARMPLASRLRHRVEVQLHPDAGRWTEWVVDHQIRELPGAAEVHVGTTVLRAETRLGLGSPWSAETRLSDDQLVLKFQELARPARPDVPDWPARLDALVERVMNVDRLPSAVSLLEPISHVPNVARRHA